MYDFYIVPIKAMQSTSYDLKYDLLLKNEYLSVWNAYSQGQAHAEVWNKGLKFLSTFCDVALFTVAVTNFLFYCS